MSFEQKLFNLISFSREDARKQVVLFFLEEAYGSGSGELCSKYEYIVESYNEYKVILNRPAPLNKGFDFIVNVHGLFFKGDSKRRHTNPSHNDIVLALKEVQSNVSEVEYNKVKEMIKKIFKLEDFDIHETDNLYFTDADGIQRPIAIVILAIRWLFIEQDITYWNWSGRSMLMNKLLEEGLAEAL